MLRLLHAFKAAVTAPPPAWKDDERQRCSPASGGDFSISGLDPKLSVPATSEPGNDLICASSFWPFCDATTTQTSVGG